MANLIREARLRPEAAHLYPEIPPGVWIPAADIGAKLLMMHLASTYRPPLGSRLLDDAHFEFRGGLNRTNGMLPRTRWSDNGPKLA